MTTQLKKVYRNIPFAFRAEKSGCYPIVVNKQISSNTEETYNFIPEIDATITCNTDAIPEIEVKNGQLPDGSVFDGASGCLAPAGYNYVISTRVFSNLFTRGTPEKTYDGVLSGFSSNAYIYTPFNCRTYVWEIIVKVKTPKIFNKEQDIFGPQANAYATPNLRLTSEGKLKLNISNNGESWNIADGITSELSLEPDAEYTINTSWNKNTYTVSVNGETYITLVSDALISTTATTFLAFGWSKDGEAWEGIIDLKDTLITINKAPSWQPAQRICKIAKGVLDNAADYSEGFSYALHSKGRNDILLTETEEKAGWMMTRHVNAEPHTVFPPVRFFGTTNGIPTYNVYNDGRYTTYLKRGGYIDSDFVLPEGRDIEITLAVKLGTSYGFCFFSGTTRAQKDSYDKCWGTHYNYWCIYDSGWEDFNGTFSASTTYWVRFVQTTNGGEITHQIYTMDYLTSPYTLDTLPDVSDAAWTLQLKHITGNPFFVPGDGVRLGCAVEDDVYLTNMLELNTVKVRTKPYGDNSPDAWEDAWRPLDFASLP